MESRARDRYERLCELFARAYPLEREARRELLDRECAAEPELRAELSHLLRIDDRDPVRASAGPASSVLERLEDLLGETPSVMLRDGSERGPEPVTRRRTADLPALDRERDGYELHGEIARGGMGAVLKGRDPVLGREVALKVLHRELCARPEMVQRFVEEAQIGGQLQHPGIVPVYQLGLTADERPYFAMKLVRGQTLASQLRARGAAEGTPRELLKVFEQVCLTVAYAHDRGVIHRDLKPSNVMVGAFGEVQVVDWGLAKVVRSGGSADDALSGREDASPERVVTDRSADGSSHSCAGSVMGTPAYMSPEQARGDIERVDERSDVFALGAILCELLTGAPPYRGTRVEQLQAAAGAELAEAFSRLGSCGADAELVRIARRCLSPDAAQRPADAAELATRLHEHASRVEERAQRARVAAAEARVQAAAERRSRRLTAALAASVLVASGAFVALERGARERQRRLEHSVGLELEQASLARGRGEHARALEALRRGEALAGQGELSLSLRGRMDDLRAEVERERARSEAERRRAAAEALLAERLERASLLELQERVPDFLLRELSLPESSVPGYELGFDPWALRAEAYRAAFAEFGVEPSEPDPERALQALAGCGVLEVVVVHLDDWARVSLLGGEEERARRLFGLAASLDSDPWRVELRAALQAGDGARLVALADEAEPSRSPRSLFLLASSLSRAGGLARTLDAEAAPRLLERVVPAHPDDFQLRFQAGHELALRASAADRERALRHLEAARALRPESPLPLVRIARVLASLDRFDEALEASRQAQRLDPRDGGARRALADALWLGGELEQGLAEQREAARLDPRSSVIRLELVGMLRRLDRLEEAEREAAALAAAEPEDADALQLHGLVLSELGRDEEALARYERAAALDERFELELARLLARTDRRDRATRLLSRGVEQGRPWDGELIHVLLEDQRHADALEACRGALRAAPDDAHVLMHAVQCLERLGRTREAEEARGRLDALAQGDPKALVLASAVAGAGALRLARQAFELAPDDPEVRGNLGVRLAEAERYEEAIPQLEAALASKAHARCDCLHECAVVRWQTRLAHAYRRVERWEDSLEVVRRLELREPKHPAVLAGRAGALHALGEHEGFVAAMSSYLERHATAEARDELPVPRAFALFRLAHCLGLHLGAPEEALDAAAEAADLAPDDVAVLLVAAEVMEEAGELDGARAALWRLLELGHVTSHVVGALRHLGGGEDAELERFLRARAGAGGADEGARVQLALLLLGSGDAERRAEARRRLQQEGIPEALALALLSHQHRRSPQAEGRVEAVRLLERALESDPAPLGANDLLAWELAVDPAAPYHDPRRALELVGRELALEPDTPVSWCTRAQVLRRLGDWEGAEAAARRTIELSERGEGCADVWLVVASACYRSGRVEEGRAALARAGRLLLDETPDDPVDRRYFRELEAEARQLAREAEGG